MTGSATWECRDCNVRASFAPGVTRAGPPNWIEDERGWHCLRCQREAAMEASGAGSDTSSGSRRRALLEFELLRDPEAKDFEIAKRAKCATSRVRPVRAALLESGRLAGPSS